MKRSGMAVPSNALFGELVLLVDIFAACIETNILPTHGSPCHRKARQAVNDSGMKPQRKRRRLPPNNRISSGEGGVGEDRNQTHERNGTVCR